MRARLSGHVQQRVLLGWTSHSNVYCLLYTSVPEMVDKSAFTVTKVR